MTKDELVVYVREHGPSMKANLRVFEFESCQPDGERLLDQLEDDGLLERIENKPGEMPALVWVYAGKD